MEVEGGEKVYTKSFFSHVFETSPRSVFNCFQNVEFFEGQYAALVVRRFTADMVDADTDESISLSELD